MHVAVVTTQVERANLDEFLEIYRDRVVPAAKEVAGFQDMRVLVNRDFGAVMIVVSYDTEANARAAAESGQAQQYASMLDRLSGPISREMYEVAVEA